MQVAMKAQQQLTVVFLMSSSQLVIACGHPPSSRLCVTDINVDIGNFDSAETGARAGVRALSQEIHRCAEAKEYSISWNYPGNEQERGWRALKYIRKDQVSGIIGYSNGSAYVTGSTHRESGQSSGSYFVPFPLRENFQDY